MTSDAEDRKLRRIERAYRRLFDHLEPTQLRLQQEDWPAEKSEQDLSDDNANCHFLDYYSVEGLRLALQHYGFLDKIRRASQGEPKLSLHRHEKGYDIFRIHTERSPKPLVELVTQAGPLPAESECFVSAPDRSFLHVKWLLMQNPRERIESDRQLLPGQDHPGLGLGREMMVLLQMVCNRLELDGIVELPERLHNAALYFRRFRFLDPQMQGILTAILRDTRNRSLFELAWGVEIGGLIHLNTHKPYRWIAREQVLPRSGPVLAYLNSESYRQLARQAMDDNRFALQTGDLARDQLLAEGSIEEGDEDRIPSRIK